MSGKGDRPIPVRSVAPPPASVPDDSGAEVAGPETMPPHPSRLLEIDGSRWEVRAVGRTRTGQGRDAGALLLLLTFTPAGAAPDDLGMEGGDATASGVREALAVARSLDDLDDEVLAELLERSRPIPGAGPGTGTGTAAGT